MNMTAQHRNKRRRKKRGRGKAAVFAAILILILVAALGWFHGRIQKEYILEAGHAVDMAGLVKYGKKIPVELEGLTGQEAVTPGDYKIKVKLWPFSYRIRVKVRDTIPPQGTAVMVNGWGEDIEPEDFVEGIQDATNVTVAYKQMPDFERFGTQEVHVLLKDAGSNFTEIISYFQKVNLKSRLVLEAGSPLPGKNQFLAQEPGEIALLTDLSSIDPAQTGKYEIRALVDGIEAVCILEIQDTTAPKISVKPVEGWIGKEIDPKKFISVLEEVTAVEYAYVSVPDWKVEGKGSAEIIVTDEGGNTVSSPVEYSLSPDKIPPEVAASNIDATIGSSISYKKAVGYSDNCDSIEELKLDVDNSKVNLNEKGEYEVTYTVTDTAGNSTTAKGKVFVWEQPPVYYDEAIVQAEADKILNKIITPGMSERQKAEAIYNWVHGSIGYINHSEKGDMLRGAYEGLVKRQGDCFVYACASKELLTRAGIKNMDIVKSQVNPSHFWNLVDLGDGWYHFDATPRKDKTIFFMWTDAELAEYSEANQNSHIYDESLYPEIN